MLQLALILLKPVLWVVPIAPTPRSLETWQTEQLAIPAAPLCITTVSGELRGCKELSPVPEKKRSRHH